MKRVVKQRLGYAETSRTACFKGRTVDTGFPKLYPVEPPEPRKRIAHPNVMQGFVVCVAKNKTTVSEHTAYANISVRENYEAFDSAATHLRGFLPQIFSEGVREVNSCMVPVNRYLLLNFGEFLVRQH